MKSASALLLAIMSLSVVSVHPQSLVAPARNDVTTGHSTGLDVFLASDDFDEDGFVDAVVSLQGGAIAEDPTLQESLYVHFGNDQGLFSSSTVLMVSTGSFLGQIQSGEFNGDGNRDFAVAAQDIDGSSGPGTSGGILVFFGDGSGGFSAPTVLTGGSVAAGFAQLSVGRIDGDGIDDLALLNSAADTISVFLSSAGFSQPSSSPEAVCASPTALALGDFHTAPGDDLAVVCHPIAGAGTVQTWQNNGAGDFSLFPSQPPAELVDPLDVVIEDLNDDGLDDLAIVNSHLTQLSPGGSVTILRGDGLGGFVEFAASPIPVGFGPVAIDAADQNLDGVEDLIVSNLGTEDVSILTSELIGSGSAAEPVFTESSFVAGFGATDVISIDLDGIYSKDVLCVNVNQRDATLSIFRGGDVGGGDEILLAAQRFQDDNISQPNAIAVADFDGDGYSDFATANTGDGTVAVFRSLGQKPAAFELFDVILFSNTRVFDIMARDADGDADADLLVLLSPDFGLGQVMAFRYDDASTYPSTPFSTTFVGSQPWTMAPGDFNGDASLDLAVTNTADHTVSILFGSPSGFAIVSTFSSTNGGTCLPPGWLPQDPDCQPKGIAAGDLDSDGNDDLVVSAFGGASGGTLQVFSGNGEGGFTWVLELAETDPLGRGINHQTIALSDVNMDSRLDIIAVGHLPNDFVSVFLNDSGPGTFSFAPTTDSPLLIPGLDVPTPEAPRNLVVDDVNLDGVPDVAITGYWSNNVFLGVGVGDGSFRTTAPAAYGATPAPTGLAVADVNDDGLAEFLVSGEVGSGVAVLFVLDARADINRSGRVDGFDAVQLGVAFGTTLGDPDYDSKADINSDGAIDGLDFAILATWFGTAI